MKSLCLRRIHADLSRAMTVHHAHFTVDFVVALRFLKEGIRVCLRSLFCVRAARKERPDRNENYTRSRKHVSHLDLVHTQVNLQPGSLIPVHDSRQLPCFQLRGSSEMDK